MTHDTTDDLAETTTPAAPAATSAAAPPADPRGGLFKAVDLTGRTLAALRPEQYDTVTPCPDYTVRDMANHVVSVLRRVAVLGAAAPS
ncbi:maleylpyruvate isomerase N-terminal domain-containing protein [Streptomyces kaempferi]